MPFPSVGICAWTLSSAADCWGLCGLFLFVCSCAFSLQMPWYDLCSQFRTSRVTTTSRRGESRRVAMASNSLFSSVTPCQQNFFWGECCEKLFSFHCGSASGHTEVKLCKRVDNQRRTRTHAASGTLKVVVFTFACMLSCWHVCVT